MSETVSQQRLGGFRLLDAEDPVGKGGQGTVRRAVCERADFPGLSAGATVALKIIPASGANDVGWERIESMVSTLARLDSPNLVRYYGCFRDRTGVISLDVAVMELLEGETLRARMARNPKGLGVGAALEIARSVAKGLAAAAAAGLVHRDVKPSNVFLCSDGRIKVIDFGIARREDSTLTTGVVPGTPDYMPPEVVTGASRGSAASDVYALGSCLYEALTGRTLFPRFKVGARDAVEAFLVRARQMRPPRLDALLVKANPDLERVLRRMTEPDVSRRMPSAAEAEMELMELQDAFARGDWRIPPDEPADGEADGPETSSAADAPTADDGTPTTWTGAQARPAARETSPRVPFYRRIVRNRRELFLVIALIVELMSNAVIVWLRPRHQAAADADPRLRDGGDRQTVAVDSILKRESKGN